MVVAEIPLWIFHSTTPTGSAITGSSYLIGDGKSSSDSNVPKSGAGKGHGLPNHEAKVYSLLNLWDSSTQNNHFQHETSPLQNGSSFSMGKRCAIYCCDASTTRLATGGGDGCVRIWALNALFDTIKLPPHESIAETNQKMGSCRRGGYDSSDSSHISSADDEEGEDEKKNEKYGDRTFDLAYSSTSLNSIGKKRKRSELPSQSKMNDISVKNNDATETLNKNEVKNRLLCTVSSHTGSVLALRFSCSGKYLASSGDDTHVLIYVKSDKPSILARGNLLGIGSAGESILNNSNNGMAAEEVEHWNRIRVLRGHDLDVVGLAWAPDDSHLVSCSLDSQAPVCVWRLEDLDHGDTNKKYADTFTAKVQHPFKILGKDVHTSTVKGVAFDPAGRYVATSGDDPSICIWRAFDDWGLERRIDSRSGIFHSSTSTANHSKRRPEGGENQAFYLNGHNSELEEEMEEDIKALASLSLFRRISFAPDGTHLCATNATLRGKNIAAMIGRESGWTVSAPTQTHTDGTSSKDVSSGAANLVGHKQPVVSSRHCPFFFEIPNKLENQSPDQDDSEIDEQLPKYATLVALGDKRGFVTVWSTRHSRPIFKMQCSESACTVTDISWGLIPANASNPNDSHKFLVMIVSLLDGFVVALRFDVPGEVGSLLSSRKTSRIFRLRYGIDLDDAGSEALGKRRKRKLVDTGEGPRLIENVLQYSMEGRDDGNDISNEEGDDKNEKTINEFTKNIPNPTLTNSRNEFMALKDKQIESRSMKGKKRIRPVLLNMENGNISQKEDNISASAPPASDKKMLELENRNHAKEKKFDPLLDALNTADQASSIVEKARFNKMKFKDKDKNYSNEFETIGDSGDKMNTHQHSPSFHSKSISIPTSIGSSRGTISSQIIPPEVNRVHSVDLYVSNTPPSVLESIGGMGYMQQSSRNTVVAKCSNVVQSYSGSNNGNSAFPCAVLTIYRGNDMKWKDKIIGSSCTSVAASSIFLAVGTLDGTVYLYSTSSTAGWEGGSAFRSHPPFVLSSSVIRLQLRDQNDIISKKNSLEPDDHYCELLVLTADASFLVYQIAPQARLVYKGSILAPINNMIISNTGSVSSTNGLNSSSDMAPILPKVAKFQITDCDRLLLILSYTRKTTPSASASRKGERSDYRDNLQNEKIANCMGGYIQGFIYMRDMETWIRVSDGRFRFSDFYSSLPCNALSNANAKSITHKRGLLSRMDDVVKSGVGINTQGLEASSLRTDKRLYSINQSKKNGASETYRQLEDDRDDRWNVVFTRSHCEDRMACSLALGSSLEFQYWLRLYIRRLTAEGDEVQLRFVLDMLIGDNGKKNTPGSQKSSYSSDISYPCWWLSSTENVLDFNRKEVIKKIIIPEMTKNRELQRFTNEINVELEVL